MRKESIQRNTKNKVISRMLSVVFVIALLTGCVLLSGCSSMQDKKAAEKYADRQFTLALGIAPQRVTSEVIHSENGGHLVVVKYYLDNSSDAGGSMCVYCKNGVVINATSIMAPEYPYTDDITTLKDILGM